MSIFRKLFQPRSVQPVVRPEPQPVARPKAPPVLLTTDDEPIKQLMIISCFDLDEVSHCYDHFYLLGENSDMAASDILALNEYWRECRRLVSGFPALTIREEDLCFTENIVNGFSQFCFLSFAPMTKTGKLPKYPVSLHFHVSQELFGTAHYGQSKSIERVQLTAWRRNVCWEIVLASRSGELSVSAIYKHDPNTFKKEKVYSR